jgi:hypothetical protein
VILPYLAGCEAVGMLQVAVRTENIYGRLRQPEGPA